MDVERTMQFLLENAARASARMDRADARFKRDEARIKRIEAGLEKNKKLTVQLIGLMSQQATHQHRLSQETDRRFQASGERMEKDLRETWEVVRALGKRMDAFLAAGGRLNGHGRNGKKNK